MHKRWVLGLNDNSIQLTWKMVWKLKTYKTCNSMVRFSKYEFYNKLLGDVTPGIT